jgi:alkylation response protein AidB-like acyl-CoA dehydrogenase
MTTDSATPVLPLVPSSEEAMLRETVRSIVADFGHAYSIRKTEAGEPPTELWDALASRGYLGVNLPEEYGGGGLGMAALAAVGEEISAGGCSLLLIVVSPAIAGSILVRHGTEEQKDRWVRGIAAGTTKVAFAITEPDAGSNSHNISTAARRGSGDRWVLRGTKTYISGVEDADAILVVARQRHDDGNLGLPLLFVVDSDAPGLEKRHIPTALRAPDKQWQLFFDDVEVGADRLVGSETAGLKAVFDGLNPERIMGAAIALGAGRRALEMASAYARERVVWNAPIGAHQGISHPLAQAKIELELARLMTQKAAALYDAGAPAGEPSNMAKYAAAEAAIRCVDQAIQTHGGNGFALEYGLTDMYWGVRLTRTAPVSREMILNYVAEHSLGLPRSY